ncbi:MAG: 1-acyl-sn-glycerol-3-phosphate acyltransferase [Candidatus Sumerlaeaceae bacterium]|nr:1-acyl-sn-glycerol-3-phosphate acyltransferase [Candidatus Sumerlaeaceae bacterium]
MWARVMPGLARPKHDILRTNILWEITRIVFIAYYRLFHCLRYRGQQNLPQRGPAIIAPNHVSYYDATVIPSGIPYRMRFMAMEPLFRVPILGWFISLYGAFPVKLKSPDKSAISETLKVLKNNEVVLIFPEGGRSPTGKLCPFEQGAARLALATGAMVVPVSIVGAYEAWPRHHLLPRWFRPIVVTYHRPIAVPKLEDRSEIKKHIDELNELIARPIQRRLEAWDKLKRIRRRTFCGRILFH